MNGTKAKQFRDSVHGYIAVPESFCERFIDTSILQRLKHIEQTSMRPLYPSARHDRFVHSLGVFHLASMAYSMICQNTAPRLLETLPLDDYRAAFRVAALMHDCGHSPFSHSLEAHYNRQDRAKNFLLRQVVDEEFSKDYASLCKYRGAPKAHEVFSAAVFLKHYHRQFANMCQGIPGTLVARMITGCVHWEPKDKAEEFENCLITLINGAAIDVDKLDYILRDTWASGVNNVSIDVHRLLAALELVIRQGRLTVAFRKSALSVIRSVIDGRNFLYRWVYSHHTVKYYDYVLNEALLFLDRILSGDDGQGRLLDAMFSEEAFERPVCVGPCCLYLPCDDDIFSLLKMHAADSPHVEELLSRKPHLIPLWKTQAEFELIFRDKDAQQRAYIQDRVAEKLNPVLGITADSTGVLTLPVAPGVLPIEESNLFVTILNDVMPFKDLAATWQEVGRERQNVSFFYVYIPRACKDRINDCIGVLKAMTV